MFRGSQSVGPQSDGGKGLDGGWRPFYSSAKGETWRQYGKGGGRGRTPQKTTRAPLTHLANPIRAPDSLYLQWSPLVGTHLLTEEGKINIKKVELMTSCGLGPDKNWTVIENEPHPRLPIVAYLLRRHQK